MDHTDTSYKRKGHVKLISDPYWEECLRLTLPQIVKNITRLRKLPCLHDSHGHHCPGTVRAVKPGYYAESLLKNITPQQLQQLAPNYYQLKQFKNVHRPTYLTLARQLDSAMVTRHHFCCFETCPHYYIGFGDARSAKRHIWDHLHATVLAKKDLCNLALCTFYWQYLYFCVNCHARFYFDKAATHLTPCEDKQKMKEQWAEFHSQPEPIPENHMDTAAWYPEPWESSQESTSNDEIFDFEIALPISSFDFALNCASGTNHHLSPLQRPYKKIIDCSESVCKRSAQPDNTISKRYRLEPFEALGQDDFSFSA